MSKRNPATPHPEASAGELLPCPLGPSMGPCDIPTPYPCLKCGRHTKHPGARCSDAVFCDGRSASAASAPVGPSVEQASEWEDDKYAFPIADKDALAAVWKMMDEHHGGRSAPVADIIVTYASALRIAARPVSAPVGPSERDHNQALIVATERLSNYVDLSKVDVEAAADDIVCGYLKELRVAQSAPVGGVEEQAEDSVARWLLRNATIGTNEDGDRLYAWFNIRPNDEHESAFLDICEPSGDDGEVTAEDAPFLTDAQRADINGTVPHAKGCVDDVDTIIAAIRYVADLPAHPAPPVPVGVEEPAVDEDDLCEDCLTQRATEFFETVPNQRCKDCTIKMLDEVCERLQAEKPTPIDDPQAKGRIAVILRDYPSLNPLEVAERILKAIGAPAVAPPQLSPAAQAEIDAFTVHLREHRPTEASVEGCRFCIERNANRLLNKETP